MFLALASLLFSAPAPQDPRAGEEPDGNKLVRVELVSECAKLHPGERFTLAAKLTVTPRWHIYWGENPGDTGVPTRLELDAPKGFVVSAPRFPVPLRHEDPGALVSYVHEGQVLVLFDVAAPEKLEPGAKQRFELSASWLVCTQRCFEGEGEAALELDSAPAGEPVKQNEALFTEARAKLPRPLSELGKLDTALTLDASGSYDLRALVRVAGATEITFTPADQREPAFVAAEAAPGQITLQYRWKEPPKGERKLRCPGILGVKSKSGTASYWFDHEYVAAYGN